MPCYRPVTGYRSRSLNPSGKRSIVFERSKGLVDRPVTVPCGRCIGCRLERSRQWAVRCMMEAQLHAENSFITLTYSPSNVPVDGNLDVSHFQKFMKRLRKMLAPEKVTFFHCGEYGDSFQRPHYHACIFGYGFPDRKLFTVRDGVRLYRSETLERLWPAGFSTVGDVTFQSAAYVARYVTKKRLGKDAASYYREHGYVNKETGELTPRKPEYVTMSRAKGIGRDWYSKFGSDVYPSDQVIANGFPQKPPKYFDGLYELENEKDFRRIQKERMARAARHKQDSTPRRLRDREQCKEAQVSRLHRGLDHANDDDLHGT